MTATTTTEAEAEAADDAQAAAAPPPVPVPPLPPPVPVPPTLPLAPSPSCPDILLLTAVASLSRQHVPLCSALAAALDAATAFDGDAPGAGATPLPAEVVAQLRSAQRET